MDSRSSLLSPARVRRYAAVVLAAVMTALLLVVPGKPAAAADPLVFTFQRTTPFTAQAGQPALFDFTASKPVSRVEVTASDAHGEFRLYSGVWTSSTPTTSGTVALEIPAEKWPEGKATIQNVRVEVAGMQYPISFLREGAVFSYGTTGGGANSIGPLSAFDFAVSNPALPRRAPALTMLSGPSSPVVPGQNAAVQFALGLPAQKVQLRYINDSGQSGPSDVTLTWSGPASTSPASGTATGPVTAATFDGGYTLTQARVTYLGGSFVTYYRDGRHDGSGSEKPFPETWSALEEGDFQVINPHKVLMPISFPSGVKIATDYALGTYPTADVGVTEPSDAKLEYEWFKDGQPVEEFYDGISLLGGPIGGSVLTLRVTARAADRLPTTVTSPPIGPMPRQLSTALMFMKGKASLGGQVYPEWSMPPTVYPEGGTPTYSYVWKRDGAVIPGARNAIYTVTKADLGHILTVDVTVMYEPLTQTTVTTEVPVPLAPRGEGFNGDRTADLFARTASGDLLLYPGNGKGGWLPAQTIGRGWGIFDTLLAPGDFDGDGATDVIGRDRSGKLFLYSGNGTGGWKGSRQIGQGWQGFKEIVTPGDFNRDGANDLLAKDQADRLILYPGDGAGGWRTPVTVGWGWGGFSRLITPGWWMGYHETNILAQTTSGELKVYYGLREGFADMPVSTVGTGWNSAITAGGPGDFNGDGSPDVFGIDANGTMTMYWGNGTGINGCGLGCGAWKGSSAVGWGWGALTAVF
ncbi:FG-GAP repeat domain-containing protein [Paenarthrobacter sp. NPDC091711]|uniref:FG-GAP repeat domain-containing protein n=1 Tax=Paenarthrobacter sp. NPDC091711 TaxID=3364385 RepID=UPI00381603D1